LLSLNLQEEVDCCMELIEQGIRDEMEEYTR
jgi:ditrans,polycis-polyprenyl diphosphate synthase